jgi:hypothetical protein
MSFTPCLGSVGSPNTGQDLPVAAAGKCPYYLIVDPEGNRAMMAASMVKLVDHDDAILDKNINAAFFYCD